MLSKEEFWTLVEEHDARTVVILGQKRGKVTYGALRKFKLNWFVSDTTVTWVLTINLYLNSKDILKIISDMNL